VTLLVLFPPRGYRIKPTHNQKKEEEEEEEEEDQEEEEEEGSSSSLLRCACLWGCDGRSKSCRRNCPVTRQGSSSLQVLQSQACRLWRTCKLLRKQIQRDWA